MTKITIFQASWVLPITAPPIPTGAVVEKNGMVVDLGPAKEMRSRFPTAEILDLGSVVLLPGLTNAHTHLSLTNLSAEVAETHQFNDWLARVAVAAPGLSETEVQKAVDDGIKESLELGTTLLGEITTRPEGVSQLARSPLAARVYYEFLGVTKARAYDRFKIATGNASNGNCDDRSVRPGLSPHAPYSVWPDLWKKTADFVGEEELRWSSHVGESPGEREFLVHGTGPLMEMMKSLGVWDPGFETPGCGAVEFLQRVGALDHRALLVHAVDLLPVEIGQIESTGASLCLCPRSNQHLGLPPPPLTDLLNTTIPLCLGTDSKASNVDLGVWGEMRALRKLVPDLPAERILFMATRAGATALGMEDQSGSIQPGIPARLITVALNGAGSTDPVEFLVREPVEPGVTPLPVNPVESEVG